MQRLQGHVLYRPRIKPIIPQPDGDNSHRLLLLSEDIKDLELTGLPDPMRAYVQEHEAQPLFHKMDMDYSFFTADQVLRKLLPEGMEVPSSFEQVGHVAHVNLRDEVVPYKNLIGQVLLDKNFPRIRTIVNKLETISNEFRVFPMEVIAGEDNLLTQVKENGATFKLDYREVYWNSRLEKEHRRVIQMLRKNDVVCDMFAGIGPFAVPLGVKGCGVYANDLNPHSAKWLRENVQANKASDRVQVSNLDARDFVRQLLRPPAPTPPSSRTPSASAGREQMPPPTGSTDDPPSTSQAQTMDMSYGEFNHVLMNLPASALEFLDVFVGAFRRDVWTTELPRVHCYCFSKSETPERDVIQRAEEVMGCELPHANAIVVRDVAPGKLMLCVSFQIPEHIGFAQEATGPNGEESAAKRPRTEGSS